MSYNTSQFFSSRLRLPLTLPCDLISQFCRFKPLRYVAVRLTMRVATPVVLALLPLTSLVAWGQTEPAQQALQPQSAANAQQATQPAQPALELAPTLEEHPLHSGTAAARFVLGKHITGRADREVSVVGHGEVRSEATVIKGDRLHYDTQADQADAYGHVRLIHQGSVFTSPEAHLKVSANEGYLLSPTYHFNLTGGSGQAKRINLLDANHITIEHGTYTGCRCADPAWLIKASWFDIDNNRNLGVAHNSVLYFQGFPLFASPYVRFPLSNERQSGLLPPNISVNSRTGIDITLPYYWNIAPNRDFTFYPRLMSQHGMLFGGEYRYLMPSYSGSISAEGILHDEVTQTNRYALHLQHQQHLGTGLSAYINYDHVSDDTYLQDLRAYNLFSAQQLLLQQEAGLTYNQGPWSVLTRVQHWQTLPPSIAPYGREPELNVKYQRYEVENFDFGAETDYSRFRITTADATEGDRMVLHPSLSYPIVAPGYFIVPKFQYHLAAYDLNHISSFSPVGQPRNITTAIPTLSLDNGLIFERTVSLWGQDYIQTLEPRAYYVYTPFRNQDFVPLFDTAEADFGLAEIYTENTFIGNDRIADANRLTAGLTTRFINPASGDERARFLIAQQYYFRQQRVTLTPDQPSARANHSDWLFGAALKLGMNFASETALQYNADTKQLIRSNVGFAWSPADREVVNAAYRYTRANTTLDEQAIKQLVVSAQWPLTKRLYGVGRINYDLDGRRLADGLAGFQYDADCWSFGLAIQRYANGINLINQTPTPSARILAQLELKGLSKIDNGLIEQFRAGISGYLPLPTRAPPVSRFSDYE